MICFYQVTEKIQEVGHSTPGISWARPIKSSPSTVPRFHYTLALSSIVSHHHLPPGPLLQCPFSLLSTGWVPWENMQEQVSPVLQAFQGFMCYKGCSVAALTPISLTSSAITFPTFASPVAWSLCYMPSHVAPTVSSLSRIFFSPLSTHLTHVLRSLLTCCLFTEAFPNFPLQKSTPSHGPCLSSSYFLFL